MALRNCTMLHVVAGSCMFRIIVQVASPFGDDSESKTQVNEQKIPQNYLNFGVLVDLSFRFVFSGLQRFATQ